MSTTYNERVRSRAEEFARKEIEGFDNRVFCEELIERFIPLAEIAVRREAEAYKVGYMDCELGRPKNSINDLGLINDKIENNI